MTTSNEDLLMEMQRVGMLMRRQAHAGCHRGHGGPHHGPDGTFGDAQGGPGMPPHGMGHGCPHPHGAPQFVAVQLPAGHPPVGGPHMHGSGKGHGHGMHHGRARILAMLQMQDGVAQKDLAFLLGIRPQSLTVALDKLEGEGLIQRKQDESDKRSRKVFITEQGKQKAAEQAQARASRADEAFAVLSDEEKAQLAAILAKLSAALGEEPNTKGDAAADPKE